MARVAKLTLGYYTLCTAAAVALGIVLVTVIQPGQGSPLSGGSVTSCHTPDLKVRLPSLMGSSSGAVLETVIEAGHGLLLSGRLSHLQFHT